MGAVHRAERVGDVRLAQRRQCLRELRVVLLLLGVKADVLQQQHAAGRQPFHRLLRGRADHLRGEGHRGAEQFLQPLRRGRQRKRRVALPLGPAQVRDQHHAGALFHQVTDGGQGRPDARIVRHAPVVQRHVEVHPHQHLLSGHVHPIHAQFCHAFSPLRRPRRFPATVKPPGPPVLKK
jgi:hypothetical protein